jgi:Flp pilus assembly protein TadG
MVEFALSSVVLMLIIGGLIDIGRAVSVSEVLSSAAREGARHGAWFDYPNAAHTYLTDDQIKGVVDAVLTASSLPASTLKNPGTTCPNPTDGNAYHNPPYANSAYPTGPNDVWLYICYDNTPGVDITAPPTNQSQQDLNVIVLYSYGPLTPLISAQFGTFHLAANEHITVQGP